MRRPVRPAGAPAPTNGAAIAAMATSSFVFVTAETLPVGLLPEIAGGLSVTEAQVGLLLTTYAAVAAVSTIPLTSLSLRVPRHTLLAGLVAVFAVSQLAASFAPTFLLLTLTRLVCALAHGVFWSALAPAAARLAPPGQAGRATSMVFVGNSLALVLGVPLGTALGQLTSWRVAVASLGVAGALSALALLRVLPALPALVPAQRARVRAQASSAWATVRSRALTPVCAVTTILVVGHFAAYTYIAPLVRRDGGLDGLGLSALLLGYGAAGLVGTVLVGRAVDRRPGTVLVGTIAVSVVGLAVLTFARADVLTSVAVLAWGAGFTAVPVCLQAAVMRVAPDAQDAASAVYVVAFQIGIGGGALVGERLVTGGALDALPPLAAVLAVLAAVVGLSARRAFPLRAPAHEPVAVR
ncbi:MFS transporter [Rhodococcus antarcticus]|uniref:MFS transporter n=1 Tax=Rhodococcus antarcticus TaxID=2987751 RepID=A0ABY6P090_9NOCA|nr:MFS transporter [Rhodococcus antarcticus]UZJ24628.1 MFS transporter [Rhodococcus antarcticus]